MANLMVDKDVYGRDVFANSRSSLLHLSQVLIGIGQMAKILWINDIEIWKWDEIMNKQEIYDYLKEKNIWHEITEHEAVYNMKELSQIDIPYPDGDAKNLFLRDDKKRNYYIITVKGYKRVNLKEFRQKNNTRSLSFASENDLMRVMNLIPGSVTPLGILNDKEIKVEVFIDEDFIESPGLIGIHPNDNTATVWLKTKDLINVIKEHGNKVNIVQI